LLARETVSLRRLFVNRFFAMIIVVALLIGGISVFINANDGASLSGTVVDGDGDPVTNATVEMRSNSWEARFIRTTTTNTNGEFLFRPYNTASQQALSFRLSASKEGFRPTQTDRLHVLFRNQSMNVDLVITRTNDTGANIAPVDATKTVPEKRRGRVSR
jgi:hypothetical protein